MTIYEDTNSKPLLDLLDRIHSGDMVLPDFQRDFVWEPSATQALIVSIANNYPAGSILRVRDRQRAFSSRVFEGFKRNQRRYSCNTNETDVMKALMPRQSSGMFSIQFLLSPPPCR